MVEQRRVELRTSILQGSTAARCLPRNGAQSWFRTNLLGSSNRCFHQISFLGDELRECATSRLGADGENRTRITGVALQGPANRPRPHLRWWVTAESNRARAKAQALQARSVTRLGVTQKLVAGVRVERTFRGYEPRPGPGYRSGHPAKSCRGFKLLSGAGVHPAKRDRYLADGVGFEPTVVLPTSVFKTAALSRSATHPYLWPPR